MVVVEVMVVLILLLLLLEKRLINSKLLRKFTSAKQDSDRESVSKCLSGFELDCD